MARLPTLSSELQRSRAATEVERLERLIVRIWQLTSAFGVVTGVLYALLVSRPLGLACASASAVFLVWFAFVGYVLDRGEGSAALWAANTLAEALIPWAFIIAIVESKGAPYALASWVPPLLYAACSVAYVARLRPWLPLMFGGVCAFVYPFLYVLVIRDKLTPEARLLLINQPATQLTRSVAMLGGGAICALLTTGLRHVVLSAEGTGDLLARYRIEREVASGPLGTTHLASYHPQGGLAQHVMLRRLPRDTSPELGDAFRMQAALARRFAHPNTERVVDFGDAGDTYAVVTELIDGVPLEQLTRRVLTTRTALDPALVRHIGMGLFAALELVHEARDELANPLGEWFRDLSPAWIFLCRDGGVKLGGLWVPPMLRAGQRLSEAQAAYASPEQIRGVGDSRSDLYSAGAVLWELLSATPFEAEPARRLDFEPETGWNEFFARALAPDPEERAASARELSEILAPFAIPMRDKASRVMSGLVNALLAPQAPNVQPTVGPGQP